MFRVNTDGSAFTNLHSLNSSVLEGTHPYAGLLLSGNSLYGTAEYGGTSGNGALYAVNTDGMAFTNLYNFTGNIDGANPSGGLILSGTNFYGTAFGGGLMGNGTVFRVNTSGTGFTLLHIFFGNMDGNRPVAGLVLSSNVLYGATMGDFISNDGDVFTINFDGTDFTNLQNFGYRDGAFPKSGLLLSGNSLYGTTAFGGNSFGGTVYAVNTDGTFFTNLYNFSGGSDGAAPLGGLVLLGDTLYGTVSAGGDSGNGAVFAIKTDGTGFTNLHNFTALNNNANSDGVAPFGGLVLLDNTLYGTASAGGTSGNGTIFSLSFAPQLTIALSGSNVILTWPTNVAGFSYAGYILQSATNIASTNWSTISPPPVVVNGQNTVTNAISGTQMFYRLSQ